MSNAMNPMYGFDEFPVESKVEEYLGVYNEIKDKIAVLKVMQENMGKRILTELKLAEIDKDGNILSVAKDGQQKINAGRFNATIKTVSSWRIDKDEYQVVVGRMRNEFNPVKTSVSYRLDKKVLTNASLYGSKEDNDLIASFTSFKYTFSISTSPKD